MCVCVRERDYHFYRLRLNGAIIKSAPRLCAESTACDADLVIHLTSDLAQKNFELAITTPTIRLIISRLTQIRTNPRIAITCRVDSVRPHRSQAINVYLSIINRCDDDTMMLNVWCARAPAATDWMALYAISVNGAECFSARCRCRFSHGAAETPCSASVCL